MLRSAKSFFFFVAALSLCFCLASAANDGFSNGNFQFFVGELPKALVIKFVGNQNVPMYQYFMTDSYIVKYKLQMNSVYEANISSETGAVLEKYPGTSLSLASLNWVFSQPEFDSETNQTSFNITNSGTDSHGRWTTLSFVNHVSNSSSFSYNENNSTEIVYRSFKFDVNLEGYQWQSSDPAAGLVIEFDWSYSVGQLPVQPQSDGDSASPSAASADSSNSTDSDPNQGRVHQDGQQTLRLMQAVLNVEAEARDENDGSVAAFLQYDSGRAQLVYGHFNQSLFHDPTVAIDESQPLGPGISSSSLADGGNYGGASGSSSGASVLQGSALFALAGLALVLLC